MKIVFICTGLEPGKNGVGDYTRRIAIEMNRQGHPSTALSLNDKFVSDAFYGYQQSDDGDLAVLRLPSRWSLKKRISHAKKHIDELNPEWLSLQLVINGFQDKGLPFIIGKNLAHLGKGRQWHVMFHELWVQKQVPFNLKFYLWAKTQRLIIKAIPATLKPAVIHTHAHQYQLQLARLGISSQHLPLFSNIPKFEPKKTQRAKKNDRELSFVIFGTIHPGAAVKDFVKEVASYKAENNMEVSLIIAGHNGIEKEHWINEWKTAGMTICEINDQSPRGISMALSSASLGISTTPPALIEKSGSVAAMQEHGLKVICVPIARQPENISGLRILNGIYAYKKGNLKAIIEQSNPGKVKNISVVTHQLAAALLTRMNGH